MNPIAAALAQISRTDVPEDLVSAVTAYVASLGEDFESSRSIAHGYFTDWERTMALPDYDLRVAGAGCRRRINQRGLPAGEREINRVMAREIRAELARRRA